MKDVVKAFGVLSLAVLLALVFGGLALHAETGAEPSVATADLPAGETVQPDPECDPPAEASLLDLQPPTATPASGSSGSFYVCFGNDLLCGGCPGGTHCATEACGSFLNPTCTFQMSCVTSCQVSPGCRFIGHSC